MSSRSPGLTTTLAALITLMSPLVLSSADTSSAAAGEEKKLTSLKLQPLPIIGQALCPTDLEKGVMSLTDTTGTVIPKNKVSVNGTQELNILGTDYKFSGTGSNVSVAVQNGAPVRLKQLRDGLGDLLPVAEKKGGTLALPVVTGEKKGYVAHYRAGSAATGRIKKDTIFFYDSNLDGKYSVGSVGSDGVLTGSDSVSIGSGVVFASLGKYLATTDGLMTLSQLAEDGSGFQFEAATEETGSLDVRFPMGAAEAHAVFTGPNNIQVVVSGGKPLVTLPGEYRLSYGLVTDRRTGMSFAGIVPGDSKPITVAAGKDTTKANFGGPFTADVSLKVLPESGNKPKQIVIDWPAFRNLRGAGGEHYVDYRLKNGSASVFFNGKQVGAVSKPC
jgi:hypothetical protein